MKDTIANLQAARDRLMAAVTAGWGDAFDGDFDSMLEAINEMKRYHANIDADRAEFRQLAEQRAELLDRLKVAAALLHGMPKSLGYDHDARGFDAVIARIANATQQRNATGGEG